MPQPGDGRFVGERIGQFVRASHWHSLPSQRARCVALACEVVSEDHITRSKTARGAIANSDFHLPRENEDVLSPRRGVPIAPIVRRETAEHEASGPPG